MAEPHLSGFNGTTAVVIAPVSPEQRKLQLTDALAKKVKQGYIVESRTDTDAVLVSRGRRKLFGLREGGADTRQAISIDGQGRASMRSL